MQAGTAHATAAEVAAMRRAMELGESVRGVTSPNPPVGAVVIDRTGVVVGEGATQPAGQAHAEVRALTAAGERARGGTMVCTLEPCAHTGRTGPCAQAIVDAGIARVVLAVDDPNPLAAGGAETLRAAGIDVVPGLLAADAASEALRFWLHGERTGRPFVTWKVGASLDGQVAAADGSSQWITSAESRAEVHALRAKVDAVIVGGGTLRADNPRLTVRAGATLAARQPLRVVATSRGEIPAGAAFLDGSAPTLVAVGAEAGEARLAALATAGVDAIRAGDRPGEGVDPARLLGHLFDRGVRHALLEGGPTLAGSFISEGLVDEVIAYLAPALLVSGMWPALRGYGVRRVDETVRLRFTDITTVGPDVRITAVPTGEEP